MFMAGLLLFVIVLLFSVMFLELSMYVAPLVHVCVIWFSVMKMLWDLLMIIPVLNFCIVKPLTVTLSAVIWMAVVVSVPLSIVKSMPVPISAMDLLMVRCSLYVPSATRIVSPVVALLMADCIVGKSVGTLIVNDVVVEKEMKERHLHKLNRRIVHARMAFEFNVHQGV